MNEYHFFQRRSFIFLMIFYVLGLIYLIVPPQYLLPFTYVLTCIIIICLGIFKLSWLNFKTYSKKDLTLDIIEGIVNLFVGVICYNFGRDFYPVTLVCGIIYTMVPLTRVLIEQNKFNQAFIDSPKFLLGIVLITTKSDQPHWVAVTVGTVFVVFATTILIFKLIHLYDSKKGIKKYE